MRARKAPCEACPWVTGNTAAAIPGYDHAKAEALARTCPDSTGMGPDWGAPIFACHDSVEGHEVACAGWVATQGSAHPAVRLSVAVGSLNPARLAPGPDWPDLHPDFAHMITNLRATRTDRKDHP